MGTATGRGFSLLEVIVAIAIMALVAAIALPAWNGIILSFRLSTSARIIQSELQTLKIRSTAENTAFNVAYTAGASEFEIRRGAHILVVKHLPPGILITRGGVITFSSRGTANGSRVRLMSRDNACHQVVVSQTGRIRNCRVSCGEDC
jgi:prepilin-type N-terminal cleavage/methylation domain-containing protein